MSCGQVMRMRNKHRKIVLKRSNTLGEDFTVTKVVNTTDVFPRESMTKDRIEKFIDMGFTVEIS